MAIGDADLILDEFMKRGIGDSGLASRRIQQADIENNKSLRSNINQSVATLQNQKSTIDSNFLAQLYKSQGKRLGGGVLHKGTREQEAPLNGVIRVAQVGQQGAGANLNRLFSVETTDNTNLNRQFESLEELSKFLKSNSALANSLAIEGTDPDRSLNDQEYQQLTQALGIDLKRITSPDTRAVFGKSKGMQGISSLRQFNKQGVRTPAPKPSDEDVPELPSRDPKKPIKSASQISTSLGKGYRK